MTTWAEWYLAYQGAVLVYFAALNLLYGLFGYLGLRSVIAHTRELSDVALKDLLERESYKPISILVPAYNEEDSIVASVRSFLALHYPGFEVIVVSDGSTDRTVERLVEAFGMVGRFRMGRPELDTAGVRRTFRSPRHPKLTVVDKEHGGKADALNAALNLARYPLIAAVDADSLLDPEAVLRASRMFADDATLVAVGGTVRPLNGAVVGERRLPEPRMPRRWVERFQILEYARAFFTGRAAWSRLGCLLVISGAFGLFRRDAVMRVGGYWTGTVSEDMELVLRLHKRLRRDRIPYRIVFTPDPICWTQVPSDLATLRRQRNRWHRGMWEALWAHRDMLFNPRYGRVGMFAVPYYWLFEGLGPVVEVAGYLSLPVSYVLGVFSPQFALLFLLLAVLYGMVLSQVAVGVETFLLGHYPRFRDRLRLLLASLIEYVGYRQLLTLERFVAMFQVWRKRGHWGVPRRRRPLPVLQAEVNRR